MKKKKNHLSKSTNNSGQPKRRRRKKRENRKDKLMKLKIILKDNLTDRRRENLRRTFNEILYATKNTLMKQNKINKRYCNSKKISFKKSNHREKSINKISQQ